MKIHTKIKNNVYVFFAYETDDCMQYGDYFTARVWDCNGTPYLTGYCYNSYYGCTERIHDMKLKAKPTISQVKKFMKDCYKVLEA